MPKASPCSPLRAARIDTASSGRLVPMATTVMPMHRVRDGHFPGDIFGAPDQRLGTGDQHCEADENPKECLALLSHIGRDLRCVLRLDGVATAGSKTELDDPVKKAGECAQQYQSVDPAQHLVRDQDEWQDADRDHDRKFAAHASETRPGAARTGRWPRLPARCSRCSSRLRCRLPGLVRRSGQPMIETTISGAEVAKPTMVRPTSIGDTPRFRAVTEAPTTMRSAPQISKTIPRN